MLNEKRVKHMVNLAFYESKHGGEDLKSNAYFKKDYISFNVLWTVIWMTIGYGILILLLGFLFAEKLMEMMTFGNIITIGICIVCGYIFLLCLYIAFSRTYYKNKHYHAYLRVKEFREALGELERMYDEEEVDE